MAHTLTPNDLLYPKGDLPLTLFPDTTAGKTAQDALQFWLAEAQALITNVPLEQQNFAARHYVYAKAYRAEANRLAATPNRTSDGGAPMSVSREWGQDRVKYWDTKAGNEEAIFASVIASIPVVNLTEGVSHVIRNIPTW